MRRVLSILLGSLVAHGVCFTSPAWSRESPLEITKVEVGISKSYLSSGGFSAPIQVTIVKRAALAKGTIVRVRERCRTLAEKQFYVETGHFSAEWDMIDLGDAVTDTSDPFALKPFREMPVLCEFKFYLQRSILASGRGTELKTVCAFMFKRIVMDGSLKQNWERIMELAKEWDEEHGHPWPEDDAIENPKPSGQPDLPTKEAEPGNGGAR